MDDEEEEEDTERREILAVHRRLIADGALEPLSRDARETRLWIDCEIASLVENRFFNPLEPRALPDELRAAWEPRATRDSERLGSPHEHAWYALPYWILEGGERVGTVALATSAVGRGLIGVSSLYVFLDRRSRGVAGRALGRARAAFAVHGRGLRVPTHWTWQPAVRFYLGLGMWVLNWKHELVFSWRAAQPEHRIRIGASEASFGVVRAGGVEHLITAARQGEQLEWTESPRMAELRAEGAEEAHRGPGTFALALATRGFPLIRSDARWARRHAWADYGDPEGLAYKLEVFEAIDRRAGFAIRAPRIPGLLYRELADID